MTTSSESFEPAAVLGNKQEETQTITIDYYDSVRNRRPSKQITLRDLFDDVRSDKYMLTVDAIAKETTKEEKIRIKGMLPAVSLSGRLTSGDRASAASENRFVYSGYLQCDIDGKDNKNHTLAHMIELVKDDPLIRVGFVSPSGEGLKCVLSIPIASGPDEFRIIWTAAERHFQQYGLVIDPSAKDPCRLCYLSYDPNAWWNDPEEDAVLCVENYMTDTEVGTMREVQRANRHARKLNLSDLQDMLDVLPSKPPRYERWFRLCTAAWHEFGEDATPLLKAKWPEHKPGEYAEKFRNRGTYITIGTLIHEAKQHGYTLPINPMGFASLQNFGVTIGTGDYSEFLFQGNRGLAEAYYMMRDGTVKYVHDEKSFRIYRDGVWEKDRVNKVKDDLQVSTVPVMVDALDRYMGTLDPKDKAAARQCADAHKKIVDLNNMITLNSVFSNMKNVSKHVVSKSDFDAARNLLVIKNGVVDFDTCTVREFRREDMMSTRANFVYDPDARCPNFDRFLNDICCGDEDLVRYLWEFMARCCTGETTNDVLTFFYGQGANGKSTFTSTLAELLGPDLATTVSSDILLGRASASEVNYSKAQLEGKRLALIDEIPGDHVLRSHEVKRLVGGDAVTARNIYESARTFQPTHKLCMSGNHRPIIKDHDEGTWRRMHLVPFLADFRSSKVSVSRDALIRGHVIESAGILNRILAARMDFLNCGRVPFVAPCVKDASKDYRTDSDQLKEFVDAQLVSAPGNRILMVDVRLRYNAWCENEMGERPQALGARKLSTGLTRLGHTVRAGTGNNRFLFDMAFVES